MKLRAGLALILIALILQGCHQGEMPRASSVETVQKPPLESIASEPIRRVLSNAEEQLSLTKGYTQDYFSLPYPNGDPPIETGACTDVIIRGFRAAGVDLQKELHEDIKSNFNSYPNKWGLQRPDTNIDHRRVPNLQTFFSRKGKSVPISSNADDYKPGDVVSWDLDGEGMTHIGLVSHLWNERSERYLIIHNIGGGARAEDRLFDWKITGHYRFF